MPENKGNYGSGNRKLSPPKIIDNPPASSLSTALSNSKKQVDTAK
jgi:hypothetical protein